MFVTFSLYVVVPVNSKVSFSSISKSFASFSVIIIPLFSLYFSCVFLFCNLINPSKDVFGDIKVIV